MSKRFDVLYDFYGIPQELIAAYDPKPYAGSTVLFRRGFRSLDISGNDRYGWRDLIPSLKIYDIPGDHVDMFHEPGVQGLANCLAPCLEEVYGNTAGAAGLRF